MHRVKWLSKISKMINSIPGDKRRLVKLFVLIAENYERYVSSPGEASYVRTCLLRTVNHMHCESDYKRHLRKAILFATARGRNRKPPNASMSHFNVESSNLQPPNYCHVCKRGFRKKFHLLQHLRVHYLLKMYRCEKCGARFAQQNGLDYHEACCLGESSRGTEPTTIQSELRLEFCETCMDFYEAGSELRNHVLRTHATDETYLGINKDQLWQLEDCKLLND